ncbi:aldehyde dehydrogenase family protein [Streptosporangium sp. NBC_01469]|uniref:aldehyde dehydrogenase family protein n=1 Tax=Streptosporangium sp. NBC_01469 TaxID=2903898 RepID=UPI002E2988B0|nr:aldehyde dehydrogenase family protein [Streptosporangium sp. NBC_01469]
MTKAEKPGRARAGKQSGGQTTRRADASVDAAAPAASGETAVESVDPVESADGGSGVGETAPARERAARLAVRKTYKLYIGGAFPRSESGRSYAVASSRGDFLANASRASRKDARDAVTAARKAFGGWSGATAYNRGQILYRVAEMLEGRRAQFTAELAEAGTKRAGEVVDAAVDRLVWYAGWSDKIAAVAGSTNPVAGPYFNVSSPEPTGVVAMVAPDEPLLGLVSVIAPVIVTGNTCVVIASERAPLPSITLAEVLATSDLPGGVVNILTGSAAEIAPWLAAHMDVNALDLTGVTDEGLAVACEAAAAENLKRVFRPAATDWSADPGTRRLTAFLETKTVWHPTGV